MKTKLNTLDGLVRKLDIEVPVSQVQTTFESVFRGVQKTSAIKGYRKGKAPLAAIRSLYGDKVRQAVLNNLITETYAKAISEHHLDPVGPPHFHVREFKEGAPLVYSAQLEVRPEVKVKNFEGLRITKEKVQITEEQIDKFVEKIRVRHATFEPLPGTHALANGDFAELDFVGQVDGQELPKSRVTGQTFEIGRSNLIDGFENGLHGMKAGDQKTLNLKFSDPYHIKSLSGKPVTFQVTVKAIKKRVLPVVDVAFVKKMSASIDVKTWREAIRKQLMNQADADARKKLELDVIRALCKANPVDSPVTLVAKQKQILMTNARTNLLKKGLTLGDAQEQIEKWAPDFEDNARRMVQTSFLIDALAAQLNLRATAADLEAKYDELAKQARIDRAKIVEHYADPTRRSQLEFQITQDRVVHHLLAKAVVS